MDAPDHVMSRFRRMLDLEDAGAGPPPDLPPVVGHYRIGRLLGAGASAIVCEAEDLALKRRVALKVLRDPAGTPGAEVFLARFHREASLAANLKHPHIVTIHEVAMFRQPDGRVLHYIVMDCVPRSLREAMEGVRFAPDKAARMTATVARAIHHAHERGIVHRDLKPGNILLDDGDRPIVTDFGLAKEVRGVDLTQSGAALGTPLYMSPEQVGGRLREIGPPTDVYALGCILHEMLAGRPPFDGSTVGEIYANILRDDPPDLRSTGPGVPPDLAAICRKAMAKEPGDRYPSAEALAQDLDRFLAGESVAALKTNTITQLGRALRRHPSRVVAAAVLLVSASAVPAALSWSAARERDWRALFQRASEAVHSQYLAMDARSPDFPAIREQTRRLVDECLAADPGRIESHLLRIKFLTHGTKYRAAEKALGEASRLEPDHPRILYLNAMTRLLNRLDAAGAEINARMADGDGGPPPPDPEASAAAEATRRDIERLRGDEDVKPHEREFLEGLLALLQGRNREAVHRINGFLAALPDDLTGLQARAMAHARLGDGSAAVADLTRAIERFPLTALVRQRAEAHLQAGLFSEALDDLDRADETSDPSWHSQRATALERLGRVDEAISSFGEAIRLDPGNGYWRAKRARILRRAGDLDGALQDCEEALRLGGPRPPALLERAAVRFQREEPEPAFRDLEEVVRATTGRHQAAALERMAFERFHRSEGEGDYLEVISLCDRALAGEASRPTPYIVRASAHRRLLEGTAAPPPEKWRRILEDADRYLQLAPEGAEAAWASKLREEALQGLGTGQEY